ncbi:MAG TPA: EamA family transporter [Caldilineaceae bacterium]|nr:EamA family transporter [Caldilineaceae bacterium]
MDSLLGEAAALLAAAGFSVTSVCYTLAGRKISPVTSIAMSLPIAWVILSGIHQVSLGEFFPTNATVSRWFYLGMSGILAFVISSYFMLDAYQHIGPRLTMLIASLAPVLGALLAWLLLGQTLPANAAIGIAMVTFGIIWVIAERHQGQPAMPKQAVRRGVVYACLGTLAQAAAFVFASRGVEGEFPPFSATLIRITAGIAALWLFIVLQRQLKATATSLHHEPRLVLLLAGAALTGPVMAGSLLLLSFQLIPVGVSTTLSHTTAIMLIPIGYFVFRERITLRAVVGTIVTVVGIGVLFR